MTSFWSVVEQWITAKKASGHIKSAKTEKSYRSDLARLERTLNPNGLTFNDITTPAIEQALVDLDEQHASLATRKATLRTIKSFMRWAHEHGHIAEQPIDDRVKIAKSPRRLPSHFTEEELRRIALATAMPKTREWTRWVPLDRALFAVLIGAGLRASEVVNLTMDRTRATRNGGHLNIVGKGGHERTIPIDVDTGRTISSYIGSRNQLAYVKPDEGNLFLNSRGYPLTVDALTNRVKSWLRQADVEPHPGALIHAFRHTYGHSLAQAGVPVPTIQELMGHEDIQTTQIYVRSSAADMKRAVHEVRLGSVLTGRPVDPDRSGAALDDVPSYDLDGSIND